MTIPEAKHTVGDKVFAMFVVEKIQEIGCCSDYECSGVSPFSRVFAVIDVMTDRPIDFEGNFSELDISNLLIGEKNGYEGTGFFDAQDAERAMDLLNESLGG